MTEQVWFYWQRRRLFKVGDCPWTPCMSAERPQEKTLGGLTNVIAGLVQVDNAPMSELAALYPPPSDSLADAAGVTGVLHEGDGNEVTTPSAV